MGFVKSSKEEVEQLVVQKKLFDPAKGVQAVDPKPSRFTKLGKAEEVFSREEIEGKVDWKYYVIPSARAYVLEQLDKIEKRYVDMPPTEGSARILRLCGHVRYLRKLLDDAGIKFELNGAILSELAREWNYNADDNEWARREERINEIMQQTGLKREEIDLNLLRPEYNGVYERTPTRAPVGYEEETELLLSQVIVFDHSDDSEDEEDDDD